jgi:hypothetical protein
VQQGLWKVCLDLERRFEMTAFARQFVFVLLPTSVYSVSQLFTAVSVCVL